MIERRRRRYEQKLELIEERMENVTSWAMDCSVEEFSSDTKTRLATYKALQEIIEASLDICAMMLKDMDMTAADDYSNLEKLAQKGMLERDLVSFLRRANGLRNRLIHEYNMISDELILEFIRSDLKFFKDFSGTVIRWLKIR